MDEGRLSGTKRTLTAISMMAASGPKPTLPGQCDAAVQLPIAAVHGQRSIPIGGMAAMRTKLPLDFWDIQASGQKPFAAYPHTA
jgi:hypothetical protein